MPFVYFVSAMIFVLSMTFLSYLYCQDESGVDSELQRLEEWVDQLSQSDVRPRNGSAKKGGKKK